MENPLDHLLTVFGGPRDRVSTPCHAEDPNNCRWHHTGVYASGGSGGGRKSPSPTSAEAELARIKADAKKSASGGGRTGWETWYKAAPHYFSHAPKPGSHFAPWTPPPKPKIRTAAEIERAIDEADPPNLEAVRALGSYVAANGDETPTRVSPLTGKAISREMNTIINALMCGVHVSDDEIMACPEWRDAERRYRAYSDQIAKSGRSVNTWSDMSKAREDVRRDVYAKMSSPVITHELNDALKPGESYAVEKGFRFDIVSGLPAGGKNYTFADRLSLEHHARLADSDIVKRLLPGYADGLGSNIVHDESTFINKDILDDTFRKDDPKFGDNLVYPTLGGNASKLIDFIETARSAGYTVHLHFNQIDAEKAKGRMLKRLVDTGRFLPLSLFRTTGNTVVAYQTARDYADTAEWYRSDAGKGIEPKEIETVRNETPKRRAQPKPAAYSQPSLTGWGGTPHHSFADAPDVPDDPFDADLDLDFLIARSHDHGPSQPPHEQPAPSAPERKSGMSIADILGSFNQKKQNGGVAK